MNNFLTQAEINEIHRDYEQWISSPESCFVTIQYNTPYSSVEPVNVDSVYGVDDRQASITPRQLPMVRCNQLIVTKEKLKLLPIGIVEEGDCIFFFSINQNLQTPIYGAPVLEGSLRIVDQSGILWQPTLHASGPVSRALLLRIGDNQLAQPVVCKRKK